jgi:NADH dehydrogenase [ubiquinone] 1 alpha subcomplex assembly factor 7
MAAEVPNPLQALIEARLAEGPLPAAEVMALALYHPAHGYYRRAEGPWGFEGKDYYTALDLGPLLGQALAHRFREAWSKLDRPATFTVLEPGAGRGWLGRDVLRAAAELDGDFATALSYLHRDDNPAARGAAEAALAPWLPTGQARFVTEAEALDPFTGAVLSNELFDALPAQPWRWDGGRWVREVLTAQGPEWHAAEPCAATAWFEGHTDGLEPGDGSIWAEGLPGLVAACTAPLQRGLFLAIDYGERADRLLAKGADLRRYKGHTVDGKWWEDLGTTDLTADVDFSRLEALLDEAGLENLGHQELSRWIRTHAPLMDWEQAWLALPAADRMKRMENLLQLTLPGMMGSRFRVLEGWRA